MKRAAISLLGFFLLCLPLLDAQSGKKLLPLGDVIDPSGIITPGISNLSWRPGGKQLTYVRPAAGKPATLCAYDLESHAEAVLFDPAGRKEGVGLSSYQWSPRGDAILLEGENDLWLLNPQSGGLRRLTHDAEAKEVPTFSPRVTGLPSSGSTISMWWT